MEFKIPESLVKEHEELHEELARAARAGGKAGEAAKEVARLLHPHFEKEEKYALPPLGLLPLLAQGKVTPDMAGVLHMTDVLKAELPRMLEEHQGIVRALGRLEEAAGEEGKTGPARFAEKLRLHAQNEEEILYPASLLVGEFVRLKAGK